MIIGVPPPVQNSFSKVEEALFVVITLQTAEGIHEPLRTDSVVELNQV